MEVSFTNEEINYIPKLIQNLIEKHMFYDIIIVSFLSKEACIMNNIDIANGIIFEKMGISKDSFDERIICQKRFIFCNH